MVIETNTKTINRMRKKLCASVKENATIKSNTVDA